MESIDPFADAGATAAEPVGPADADGQVKAAREETLRVMAEMDNQRKRLQRDVDSARKFGTERLLAELLPVCDGLEAGLKAEGDTRKLREGMGLTLKMLLKAAENHGLRIIDPAPGDRFDPESHQAVGVVESGQHDPDTVFSVLQKGYRLNERLLRPAMVTVAKEPPPPEDA